MRWFSHSTNCTKSVMVESAGQVLVQACFKTVLPVIAMLLLLAIFLNQLAAPAAEDNRTYKATMNLDLNDCTWTRKPGKESMPEHPTYESHHIPGCFQHCYEAWLK